MKPIGKDEIMAQKREVLLIDADAERAGAMASRLHLHDDFSITQAQSAESGIALAERGRFDAVLLDAEVSDMSPARAIRQLHAAAQGLAVMVLASSRSERLLVQMLEAGAIDFLERGIGIPVLVARLRAHMRLRDRLDGAPLCIGPLVVWPQRRLVTHIDGKRKMQLTEKEIGILRTLAQTPDHRVTRARLLDQVWRVNRAVETHTVETHIYRLRQKLKTLAGREVRIVTQPDGYRLVHGEEVQTVAQRPARGQSLDAMAL